MLIAGHRYVTRAEWGARAPLSVTRFSMPSAKVYIHHTAGSERGAAGMRSIQNGHMKPVAQGGRGFQDIAYSFVIDGDDGVIYEGRGPGVRGGHVTGAENNHHGVCVMGNFDNEALTDAARRSLVDLLRHGYGRGWWQVTTVVGHRDEPGASTACPGRHLYARLPDLRREITSPASAPTPDAPEPEEPDMLIVQSTQTGAALLVTGGASLLIVNTTELTALRDKAHVPHLSVSHQQFGRYEKLRANGDLNVPFNVPALAAAVAAAVAGAVDGDTPVGDIGSVVEAAVRRVFADAAD